jgi:hypothetical protein
MSVASDCIISSLLICLFIFASPLFFGNYDFSKINIVSFSLGLVVMDLISLVLFRLFPAWSNFFFWRNEVKKVTSISEKKFNSQNISKEALYKYFLFVGGIIFSLLFVVFVVTLFNFFVFFRGSEFWLYYAVAVYVFMIIFSVLTNLN